MYSTDYSPEPVRRRTARPPSGGRTRRVIAPRPVRSGTNRIVDRRLAAKKQSMHLRKLNSVKSTIDTKPPRSMKLRKGKKRVDKKKQYAKKMRNMEIQKQNNLLIRKILDLDCRNEKIREQTYHRTSRTTARSTRLNNAPKRRELERITKENQRMLQKIIKVNSEFSADKWKKKDRAREKRLRQLQQNSQNYFGADTKHEYIDTYATERKDYRSTGGSRGGTRRRPHSSAIGRRPRPKSAASSRRSGRARPASAAPVMSVKRNSSESKYEDEAYEREMKELGVDLDHDAGGDAEYEGRDFYDSRLEFEEETERRVLERGRYDAEDYDEYAEDEY